MSETKRLPRSLRFGGTPLYHHRPTGEPPQPDGVRRVNEQGVELETYANYVQRGAAGSIDMSIIISVTTSIAAAFGIGVDNLDRETLIAIFAWLPALTVLACIFYLAGGAWLLINAFPDSVEAFIQYNVPYTPFPTEIDRLCGFDETQSPAIGVSDDRHKP